MVVNPQPVFSVILTTYNHGDFIAQAIDSVLAQDFRDFELLIVDDASTDQTAGIVGAYALDNPERIRVMRHEGGENRGLVPSYQPVSYTHLRAHET